MKTGESKSPVKKYRKPPSQRMIDTLKRCHMFETGESPEPCGFSEVKHSLAALISRGLIRTGKVRIGNKDVTGFFVTEQGVEVINKYSSANGNPETKS